MPYIESPYIIVIGTETKGKNSPLAMALAAISRAMDKTTRIFLCTPTGTCEFGSNRKIPATDCARRILCDEGGAIPRLLLFDAVSFDKALKPSAGLLVWLEYYLSMCMDTVSVSTNTDPKWISLEGVVTEFLSKDEKGLWWTGIVTPGGYEIEHLAKNRWNEVMNSLSHQQQNSRRNM